MDHKYIYTSLTRISDLENKDFGLKKIDRTHWETGDYVACRILDPGSNNILTLELTTGRMRGIIGGESIVGALGERHATLEATGTWREVGDDLKMHVLTAAGLFGKLTSKSVFIPNMMEVVYMGHVMRYGNKVRMQDFIIPTPVVPFKTPVVLFTGTSMSAGKTTSARIVTNLFVQANYKVVGAKLAGAGRYKDILAIKDVGAEAVMDFVDVGLPSSIFPRIQYKERIQLLLSHIEKLKADIAIVEVGASPLEPYNGDIAIKLIGEQIKCTVLSASDPYAAYGLMKAFEIVPDIVTGIASNTIAGRAMVEELCGVKTLNLIDFSTTPELKEILTETTGFPV
ncbi:hypothetical protein [Lentiprolixibacter aurantiacus]|uniref:DUF1611 domain-containing protein n=1 Tax=Lentiprolixibacter aurantiacus TaxID=2993939 RepID=A0AAE3MMW4_9FLAO|nr:hypothetical protein [Lentiprolixibacter aurantiacus]MCX2720760.1 hypothetical protein [Lentiprolixibacter aurantiacus]